MLCGNARPLDRLKMPDLWIRIREDQRVEFGRLRKVSEDKDLNCTDQDIVKKAEKFDMMRQIACAELEEHYKAEIVRLGVEIDSMSADIKQGIAVNASLRSQIQQVTNSLLTAQKDAESRKQLADKMANEIAELLASVEGANGFLSRLRSLASQSASY